MNVNHFLTEKFHLEDALLLKEAPYIIHGNYLYDERAYIWYVGNRRNIIQLQENYKDEKDVKIVENMIDLKSIHPYIYYMMDELFSKSLYFQYFYSNRFYIKYNSQKYYFEMKDREYHRSFIKDAAFTIDFDKFEEEVNQLQRKVFYKKCIDRMICF
jgi:hypothetical protein